MTDALSPLVINPRGTSQVVPLAQALQRLTMPEPAPRKRVRPASPVVPPRAITPEVVAEIVRLRIAGGTVPEIARAVGVGRERTRAVLRERGLNGDRRRVRAVHFDDEIRDRLARGEAARSIAAALGVTPWSVERVRRGTKHRPVPRWSDREVAVLEAATSRDDGVRRYFAAFPRSTRTENAVYRQLLIRRPDLLGHQAMTPDERRARNAEQSRKWAATHREQYLVMQREYRARNREAIAARKRERYATDPEFREQTRRRNRESHARRRAREVGE